jgi:hypothetical protein
MSCTATPTDWSTHPTPHSAEDRIARATEAAAVPATDTVTARNRACAAPHAEVRLPEDSGPVTLLGPVAHKRREAGRRVPEGELPEPTRYS